MVRIDESDSDLCYPGSANGQLVKEDLLYWPDIDSKLFRNF